MMLGETVEVYHTISEGATATITKGVLYELDPLGVTINQRVPTSTGKYRHVYIPTGRIAKVVGPEFVPGSNGGRH